jgi:hypothetical protein
VTRAEDRERVFESPSLLNNAVYAHSSSSHILIRDFGFEHEVSGIHS